MVQGQKCVYLRRNITDYPNTRDLDSINIETIECCQKIIDDGLKLDSKAVINSIVLGKGKPSGINLFKDRLLDNLFAYNSGMARYVLAKLDEVSHSREYNPDLWQRNEKGFLVWTIEHIFPQGENIPQTWIDMIAGGDINAAKEIQNQLVHCLGNLTLSGYNSQLSNADFNTKQNLHENKTFLGQKINIGYKNGLSLNTLPFQYQDKNVSLADISEWTKDAIISRNNAIVEKLLKLFAFNQDELSELKEDDDA